MREDKWLTEVLDVMGDVSVPVNRTTAGAREVAGRIERLMDEGERHRWDVPAAIAKIVEQARLQNRTLFNMLEPVIRKAAGTEERQPRHDMRPPRRRVGVSEVQATSPYWEGTEEDAEWTL